VTLCVCKASLFGLLCVGRYVHVLRQQSNKWKRKAYEGTSKAEIEAASSLAELGKKRPRRLLRKFIPLLFSKSPRPFLMTRWMMGLVKQVSFLVFAVI
jgi:hypothetical protein